MLHSDDISGFVNEPSTPKMKSRRPFRLVELFVVLALIGILVGLFLPATRTAREPTRRSQCVNNLKQIGLALHNYKTAYDALPPAYSVDPAGRPLHSWRTLILPFLEQQPLYDTIDLSKRWDDPANAKARAALHAYGCPSAKLPAGTTPYLAVVAPNGCFLPDQARRLSEITDDPGLTLMVIEVPSDRAVHWMAPTDADESLILGINSRSQLNHSGIANALFLDGSTRMISAKSPAPQRRAMISIAGGDDEAARTGD